MIILISDDHFFIANVSHRLGLMGKVCVSVTRKEELWEKVGGYPPNIIILDLFCTRMDPIGIMKKLREKGCGEKIILLGGETHDSLVPEASQFGAIQVVGRPIGVNGVLCAIRIAQEQLQIAQYTPGETRPFFERLRDTERTYAT
ncbi:MAG: response regulator [Nitrospirales bacterium]|nr:response regulator [Nitrospirales bacterium]